jgi:large subunit ribosomal protein L6
MSRIGKKPVPIPDKVELKLSGQTLTVKGPKGELLRTFPEQVTLKIEGGELLVERKAEDRVSRAMHGMARSMSANMIKGVSDGFTRVLEINGVGYRAERVKASRFLRFDLGYSHPIFYELPAGVEGEVDTKKNSITLTSIDKELVGSAAAAIRSFRAPEPYKGKGVKYAEEHITRKVGKSGGR